MSEIFLTFEEIGNNQIKIERAIHYKLNGKPLFKKVWEAHKQLFREIKNWSPGIDTH